MLSFILSNVDSIYAVLAMYMLYVDNDTPLGYDACDHIAMLVMDCDICCSDVLGYLLCCNDEPMSFDCRWVARFDLMPTPMCFSFRWISFWLEVELKCDWKISFIYIWGKFARAFLKKNIRARGGNMPRAFKSRALPPPRTTDRCIKIYRRA